MGWIAPPIKRQHDAELHYHHCVGERCHCQRQSVPDRGHEHHECAIWFEVRIVGHDCAVGLEHRTRKFPVTVIGDYVQNTRACANVGNIQPLPTNTATLVFTQVTNFPCKSNQRRGYWLEARTGSLLNKGDWQTGYTRIYVEREAVLSNFNYSDIRQGTNVSEHRFDFFYMFQKNVQLGFTALIGRPLGVNALGQTEPWATRLQFDTIYIF